jgi:hypothetical protein
MPIGIVDNNEEENELLANLKYSGTYKGA